MCARDALQTEKFAPAYVRLFKVTPGTNGILHAKSNAK